MFTDLDDLATALYVTRDDFLVAHRSLSRCETPAEPPRSLSRCEAPAERRVETPCPRSEERNCQRVAVE